jgi:hypothetical protein
LEWIRPRHDLCKRYYLAGICLDDRHFHGEFGAGCCEQSWSWRQLYGSGQRRHLSTAIDQFAFSRYGRGKLGCNAAYCDRQ